MPSISPTSQGGEQIVGTASALASSSQSIQSRNAILVSHNQKGNPLLKHIRNMRWAFADVVCGDLLGQNSCALYLSIRELQKNFMLRVVLCHVDVEDVVKPLLEVTKTALLHDCTLLCTWRDYKILGEQASRSYPRPNGYGVLIGGSLTSELTHALTSVWSVNKTDVVNLGSTFGVKCLYDTFHKPFKRVVSSHPPIPKTPFLKDVEPSSVNEVTEKEPELTVKSALSTAFAKYADKMGKKKNSSSQVGETSASNTGAENNDS
ncbi:hypothetical protein CICLE_v10003373mg, partial [Citrus x clementina]